MKSLAILAALFLFTEGSTAQDSIEHGIQLSQDGQKQAVFIEQFARRAKQKDFSGIMEMIDRESVKDAPPAGVREYFEKAVFPFFSDYDKLHATKLLIRADLSDGRVGVSHYMYIVTTSGKILPFRIAVIDGPDGPRALSIVVNKCFPDRHPFCDP